MVKAYTHLNELVTLKSAQAKDGRHLLPEDLSILNNGAVVFDEKKIIWVGETKDLPQEFKPFAINLTGHVLTPQLVDSHTHLLFGGDRAEEYSQRINGTSYEEVARQGGGIHYTCKKTNEATLDELFEQASMRIEKISSYGVGTIEIKSGYGLNFQREKELAQLIDKLKKKFINKIHIFNTFLAAHDIPKNYPSSTDYINEIVIPLLEELAPSGIIDAVDIFHEKNYFNDIDVKLLFDKAKELNIPRKIHADELNTNGGAEIAVRYEALSADHLLKISDQGVLALASSKTVATLLPGTAFFLGKPLAPAKILATAGAKIALASDFNPGSCHCDNLLLIASISAAQLKLNMAQVWASITLNAAASLGLYNQGVIIPGMEPKFTLFKVNSLSHITYNWGKNFAVTLP